jgi:hypothetical protein
MRRQRRRLAIVNRDRQPEDAIWSLAGRRRPPDPRNRNGAALAHRVLVRRTGPHHPKDPHHGSEKRQPMSKPTHTKSDPFQSIDPTALSQVAGGASRVTARSSSSNDQLTLMLTQITDSIKAMSQNNSQSDPMQMMLMMMMMGGMGGGGGGAVAAPPAPAPAPAPVINISTTVRHRGW